jgi:oligoendopeptidase F
LSLKNFIRQKDHILDEKEEIIVNKAMKSLGGFSEIFDNADTLDIKFEKAKDSKGKLHEVSRRNYGELMENKDRELRKNAMVSMAKGYRAFSNTLATNYISSVEGDWFLADVNKFGSVLEESLFDGNILSEVYTNLLNNVNGNLKYMHKFYKLKQKALGLKDFYAYDKRVPICKFNNKKSYEENYELVINAMSVLGDEYIEGLKIARDNRWIDVYPCEKKNNGGFCCPVYEPHPYVLLNTIDDGTSVYTLAHELGHAMHGYLSAKNQPYETHGQTIFLAEIASTVNEVLLSNYLIKNAENDNEKEYHIIDFLDKFKATVYRQVMFAEFEDIIHEKYESGESLTKDLLCEVYYRLNKNHFSPSVVVDKDIQYEWARIPHFYTSYYVYKYATGFISALVIADRLENEEGFKDKYINFLSSGNIKYPLELLNDLGIDITDQKVLSRAFELFNEKLELLKNIGSGE